MKASAPCYAYTKCSALIKIFKIKFFYATHLHISTATNSITYYSDTSVLAQTGGHFCTWLPLSVSHCQPWLSEPATDTSLFQPLHTLHKTIELAELILFKLATSCQGWWPLLYMFANKCSVPSGQCQSGLCILPQIPLFSNPSTPSTIPQTWQTWQN